ncbi:uncharacterized protein B0I36DRAFT_310970 [Microdochium trichocladiopsis]|uniref:Uncharacterized protein n=1 Tax=Microdochium trichocladiopsis TaxID=1682393 RepID=A0A9P8YHU4_9PEZI|nr:uncharacterized protein B0I36DRAFT_310970 [Microdochium trichocladiopsis]KAH7040550.1 hypothetical protein B0I36DRAFT_310970 [Microdochium trichocladiopsis]
MAPTKKPAQAKAKTPASAARSKHARGASTSNSSPNKRAENWNFTHIPPDASQRTGNGRQKGRDLVSWARPRMMEQAMLHLVYEATTRNIRLPWDNIAHRLHPGLSGNALLQRFQRLRRELIAEGHLVPPLPGRGNSNTDPEVRGFTRLDRDGPDLETTRPVRFDEPWLAPMFNLPDAGKLVHNQTSSRKATKDATAFQLGSDEDSDSEEQDFDALDPDDGAGDDSEEDEDDGEDEEDEDDKAFKNSRRASTSRRQSIRSQKKKSYAEFDSDDEQETSNKKKSTPDRRNRAGSSSPLVRRRNGPGRRSTMSSTTQPSVQPAGNINLANIPQNPGSGSGQPSSAMPITFSYNHDGSFSFHGLNADGLPGQSIRIPPVGSAPTVAAPGNIPQEALLAMYQQMLNAQQNLAASGQPAAFHGLQAASGDRPSIFTAQHFGIATPSSSANQSANLPSGDITMGGMGASQADAGGKSSLNPEQHRLAMAILNQSGGDGSKTPVRRSQRNHQNPADNGVQDTVVVKTEDGPNEDAPGEPNTTASKNVPSLNKEKTIRESREEDDMDES